MVGAELFGTLQSAWSGLIDGIPPNWPDQRLEAVAELTPHLVDEVPAVTQSVPAFVGVGQAARTLGVHENTVRNWVDRGLLSAIRLPGSGHRRLDVAEVEIIRRSLVGQLRSPLTPNAFEVERETRHSHPGSPDEGFPGRPDEGW